MYSIKDIMMKCIVCGNEAIKYSDYCKSCEDRELSKIGGWLWLPAIGLVVTLISYLLSINVALKTIFENSGLLHGKLLFLIYFELIAFILLSLMTLFVSSLFIRKKKQLPRYYIALIIVGIAYYSVDLLLIYQVLDIKVTYKEVSTLVRSIFSACIWIPYFVVSVRVKRTFIH